MCPPSPRGRSGFSAFFGVITCHLSRLLYCLSRCVRLVTFFVFTYVLCGADMWLPFRAGLCFAARLAATSDGRHCLPVDDVAAPHSGAGHATRAAAGRAGTRDACLQHDRLPSPARPQVTSLYRRVVTCCACLNIACASLVPVLCLLGWVECTTAVSLLCHVVHQFLMIALLILSRAWTSSRCFHGASVRAHLCHSCHPRGAPLRVPGCESPNASPSQFSDRSDDILCLHTLVSSNHHGMSATGPPHRQHRASWGPKSPEAAD